MSTSRDKTILAWMSVLEARYKNHKMRMNNPPFPQEKTIHSLLSLPKLILAAYYKNDTFYRRDQCTKPPVHSQIILIGIFMLFIIYYDENF